MNLQLPSPATLGLVVSLPLTQDPLSPFHTGPWLCIRTGSRQTFKITWQISYVCCSWFSNVAMDRPHPFWPRFDPSLDPPPFIEWPNRMHDVNLRVLNYKGWHLITKADRNRFWTNTSCSSWWMSSTCVVDVVAASAVAVAAVGVGVRGMTDEGSCSFCRDRSVQNILLAKVASLQQTMRSVRLCTPGWPRAFHSDRRSASVPHQLPMAAPRISAVESASCSRNESWSDWSVQGMTITQTINNLPTACALRSACDTIILNDTF